MPFSHFLSSFVPSPQFIKNIPMKRNLTMTLLFTLWLLTINIFDILWFFYNKKWKDLYEKLDYKNAYQNFKKSDQYNNSAIEKYNIADTYYKQWDFQNALTFYNYALSETQNCDKETDFCFLNYHNLWNTYYRLWEKNNDLEQKKSLRNQAITNYEKALKIKYDKETKENLEFVQRKIEELDQQEKDKQNQQNNSGSNNSKQKWSWDNQQSQNGSWWDQKNWSWSNVQTNNHSSQENWSWNRQNQNTWNNNSNTNNSENNLSKDQTQKLQEYMQYLQQEELKNQWNFNKKTQNSDQQDIFSQFFWSDPFFDNSALNNDGKDR
jgi:Ca-activated chloride channel family protein